MQKAELRSARVYARTAVRQPGGLAVASPQCGRIAQLKALIESSQQTQRLGKWAAMMHGEAATQRNPAHTAQLRMMAAATNGPQPSLPKMADVSQTSSRPVAQRAEDEAPVQGKFEAVQHVEEDEPVQGKFASPGATQREEEASAATNHTGLPDRLKRGIESLSALSMDNVRVHYNSSRPVQMRAHAYAQGTAIHVAPGQEQHLPHEAWHVVQQAQGRVMPTRQMKGGIAVNDDAGLEREADVMGSRAWAANRRDERGQAGASAARLPGSAGRFLSAQLSAGPVQMKLTSADADRVLNDLQPIYARMRPLLRAESSTWSDILNHLNAMLGYRANIGRDGEIQQRVLTPEKLARLTKLADGCLHFVGNWQADHKAPFYFGKDRWVAKNNALNDLTPLLEQLSSSAGGELAVPTVAEHAGDAARSRAPNADHSGLAVALAAEKRAFLRAYQGLGYEARLLAGKRKVREAVETSASHHLLLYAESLGELRKAVINDGTAASSPDPQIAAAIDEHKASLLDTCKTINWQWSIPDHSEYTSREEARNHALRVARIRELFRDFKDTMTPKKKADRAEAGDIENFTGGPLDWLFG